MNTHYGTFALSVDNLDGADGETDEIEHIVTSALASAGYKSYVTLDSYRPFCLEETSTDASTAAPAEPPVVVDTEPVKESTLRYAEELRSNPGIASRDGHAGWDCSAGASLIVEASTPGPGKLGTHHGVIYSCAGHQHTSMERITGGGYEALSWPAPPGHRWNPWPCGHVTAHNAASLAALTGVDVPGRDTAEGEPSVVAYRNPDRPDVLLCRMHGDGWAGMEPVTSEQLPDGGICTWGRPGKNECGVDVLARTETP